MFNTDFYKIKDNVVAQKRGNVSYDIYYPTIENPISRSLSTINNFSKFSAGEYEKFIHSSMIPLLKQKGETKSLMRTFETTYMSKFLISFKYKSDIFDKDFEKVSKVTGTTWNTKTGSAIRLGEFFRGNVRYRELLIYLLYSKIKGRITEGEVFAEDWEARMTAQFRKENYYLCKYGIVIVFDGGTLKEDKEPCEIKLTFCELRNQLKTSLL